VHAAGYSWFQTFMGFMPGSIGETSTLAILIGAAFLLYTKIASYRNLQVFFSLGMTFHPSLNICLNDKIINYRCKHISE
jgi:Na+-transporting NADH:ubiquinone oxidoreductase subunit B